MHRRQKVQFWFPDKSDWERADRKAISGPKLRKELSRKRKELKRRQKMEKVEMDAFRNFAKVKGVDYYRETLEGLFASLAFTSGDDTFETLLAPLFVERLDIGSHPELKVDGEGRDWPTLFRALRAGLKLRWGRQWREWQQQPEFTARTGVDALPDIQHPVYSEGDELLLKLFLLTDLRIFIEEGSMFESFFKLAYGDKVALEEAKERFLDGTMCVSDVSTGPNFFTKHEFVLALKDRLLIKFAVVWDRDENPEGTATSGSADEQDAGQMVRDAEEPAGPV